LLVQPVLMAPLRREWEEVKKKALAKLQRRDESKGKEHAKHDKELLKLLEDFAHRLSLVKVLDPACGSGNFLYVSLRMLKDLEKEVVTLAAKCGHNLFRFVGPEQLYGIEINPYAAELARLVVWIGHIQWDKDNGLYRPEVPILKPLENIKEMDAILDCGLGIADCGLAKGRTKRRTAGQGSSGTRAKEPRWPECDVIVGNPPFLGGKLMRRLLGDEYMGALFKMYEDRVPHEADLCCYWFEKARAHIKAGKCKRAGLLATQGIRGGKNREVLKRIKETGNIFFAISDRQWWDPHGANVHISMVGFDDGTEKERVLDGQTASAVDANLSRVADTSSAARLKENLDIAFMGDTKGGAFDIQGEQAFKWLDQPNPHGRPNSDVLVPWVNGKDITSRPRGCWIVDFGLGLPKAEAAMFEQPFAHVKTQVKPERDSNNREVYKRLWWQHVEARPAMRNALAPLPRFIATTTVSKHRLLFWLSAPTSPDHQLIVFARADDYFFGVLHSRLHEVWALKLGTRLETRPRYTPTTCFETFPLPKPTAEQEQAIAAAAKELDTLRTNWLNPPEWTKEEVLEFPGSVNGPWARYIHCGLGIADCGLANERREKSSIRNPQSEIGTVRYPRTVPLDADCAAKLAKRTLTNLYNERPTWLDLAHKKLDAAVCAAYGWPADMSDEEILKRLLELNLERAIEK
ncbi:MAG: hypothetical protein NTW87_28505, partial [Planctomycetota bacterium]|nr:hypothetical protein [Planctomycetota bacterium]